MGHCWKLDHEFRPEVSLAVIYSMAKYAKGEMQDISDKHSEKVSLLLTSEARNSVVSQSARKP